MGLSNDSKSGSVTRVHIPFAWRLPLIVGSFCLLAALAGDAGRAWLRWDRSGIEEGEIWRLVTGHLVHLTWPHFLLNTVGLILVWLLVGHRLSTLRWIQTVVVSMAGMGLAFWYLEPQLQWYVGLSGVLHGLLMAGLIMGIPSSTRESLIIGTFVVAKLAYEQLAGPLPGSEASSGGPVLVNAHLYGTISAALMAVFYQIRVRTARDI